MRAGQLVLVVVLVGSLYTAGCARRAVETASGETSIATDASAPVGAPSEGSLPAWRDPKEKSVISDLYYGVYMMGGQKVGWQRVRRAATEWEGREALYYLSEMQLSIVTLGSSVDQHVVQKVIVASDGLPIRGHYELPQRTVEALFSPKEIRYECTAAGATRAGVLEVPEGADLRDPDVSGTPEEAKVGFRAEYQVFEPLTVQLVPATYQVEAREKISARGTEHACLRTASRLGNGTQLTSWIDEKSHDLVRMHSPAAKLEIRLEEKDVALALPEPGSEAPKMDLATETRIEVNTPIAAPERKQLLKLRVTHIPSRPMLIRDERQEWSDIVEEKGVIGATLTVRVQPAPEAGGAAADGQDAFRKPSPHIESDDPRIAAKAREIAPEGMDAARAAEAIARWVHANTRSDTSVGGLRSATEVFEDRRGVCRDYAVLYAALARAAGLPTKFCAGCVYWNRGNAPGFYYHAWNEVYLTGADGKARWVPLDTTRPDPWPVDATHLKFAEGDYGCMLDVVGLIGQLKIEVL